MVFKCIGRVVCCADAHNTRFFYKLARRKAAFFDFCVAFFPYLIARFGRQRFINSEISLKLQMSPMIKRITYKIGHCFSPRLKLIIAVGVARDIFFVNAKRTHGAPLVVVIRKPQLSYIVGVFVVVYLLWRQVAMPIEYRHFFCRPEELLCGIG